MSVNFNKSTFRFGICIENSNVLVKLIVKYQISDFGCLVTYYDMRIMLLLSRAEKLSSFVERFFKENLWYFIIHELWCQKKNINNRFSKKNWGQLYGEKNCLSKEKVKNNWKFVSNFLTIVICTSILRNSTITLCVLGLSDI